ncbi:hypothetical protein LCGC14_0295530 [marine sediment metagenome]|uniref:Bacteriophage T4 Gp32 single-stranded DNA-binding domain-containing protein n=1 Tax=marine sediment metagenome TaxID=412755 RepID=A0A0F9TS90_9ZZZZ
MAKKTASDLSGWASDINTDATKALIEELQTEGKPWDKLESSPKKYVTNYRRICPKRPEWENPYQIVPVHYLGPNSRMVVCLKETGLGECPACQLRWELQNGGDEQGARGLRPAIRTFLNVVKINQDGTLADEKVYLMGLNQLQFLGKRATEYDLEEESELPLFYFFEKYGDLSHVETGRDLSIKAKQDKQGDYDVIVMKFSAAPPSPFPGTGELLEEGLINLPEVVAISEPKEMLSIIEGRAPGALMLPAGTTAPSAFVAPEEAAAAPSAAPSKSRFGGDEEEEAVAEEPAAASEEESTPSEEKEEENPRAAKAPPKTDPAEAIKRLRSQ